MKSEICPVGTQVLLERLGYRLNAERTEWRAIGAESSSCPDDFVILSDGPLDFGGICKLTEEGE